MNESERREREEAHADGRCGDDCNFHEDDIHNWFELSYASWAVFSRAVLQAMPGSWQRRFVALMGEMEAATAAAGMTVDPPGGYRVQAKDHSGKFITWSVPPYRHAPRDLAALAKRWPRS